MKRFAAKWNRLVIQLASIAPQGSGRRGVAVVALGSIMGQASVILVSPILTRIYSPAAFGELALYTSTLTIVGALSGLKYELAVPLAESDEDARLLVYLAMGLTALMSPLVAGGAAAYGQIAQTTPSSWILLLPIGFVALAAYQALSYLAVRSRDYRTVGMTRAAQGFSMAATQVVLGLLAGGSTGLTIGHILGQASGITALLRRLSFTGIPVGASISRMRELAFKYRKFPQFSTWSGLLNSAGLQAPSLLLAWRYGLGAAGVYMMAQRISELPIRLVGHSISQVFFSEAAALTRVGDHARLSGLLKKTARTLIKAVAAPLVMLAVVSPFASEPLFGKEWGEVGWLIPLLAPLAASQLFASPAGQALVALERQEIMAAWDGVRLLIVVLTLGFLPCTGVGIYGAVAGYSLSVSAAYVVLHFIASRASRISVLRESPHE